MPWEKRGRGRYYYRYLRGDPRRRRFYVGTGLAAERAATEDEARQAAEHTERAAWQSALAEVSATAAPLDSVAEAFEVLTHAILLVNNCYLHDRAWRRRRVPNRS